ncbi:MAG: D-aminoacylase [Flammeovirgaceae bacterium]|nr:D-aminoacylase [Flammeovirgaceae bacterium]
MKKYLFILLAGTLLLHCQTRQYDTIIINGSVLDGTGHEAIKTDIGIIGDQIVKIGDLKSAKATTVIDATGLTISPGFIDLHAHIEPLMRLPESESHVRQGITTALGGPDGSGPWPLGKYLDSLQSFQLGMNVGYLTGHNTIRRNIMKLENRAPTTDELEQMKAQVSQAMSEGAFGISTGLKYLPGTFSEVGEVIALSKVAADAKGFYTSHLREEGLGLIEAVKEAIVIGKEANIPIVLTHHKAIGTKMWGSSVRTLQLVDSARGEGIDVMIDQYPYTASSTGLAVLIPSWAMAGGSEDFKKRVDNKILRDSIRQGIIFNILNDRGGGDLSRIQFAGVSWMKELEGKTLKDFCDLRKLAPTPENGADLVIEVQLSGGASCIFHAIDENDVRNIMKHPMTMIATDGRLVKPGDGHPHPRSYGTFPRVLGHYVREEKVLTLPEAIHKMTALPAIRMGLLDRGIIAEGLKADIVVFNAETVIDKATFEDPHQYPVGIEYVLVNGVITVDKGVFTSNRGGRVLYGPNKK